MPPALSTVGVPTMPLSKQYTMGANYRMSELHSPLALVGLERFPEQAQLREEMANYMDEAINEVPGV